MCELLGICCNIDTDISFSFKILKEHSIRNYHGWGYAYYQNNKWTVAKEPIMALKSDKVGQIITHPLMFDGKMFIGADSTDWQELNREDLARFLWAAAYFIDSGQQWVEDKYPAINRS